MGDFLGSLIWGAKSGQYCVIVGESLQLPFLLPLPTSPHMTRTPPPMHSPHHSLPPHVPCSPQPESNPNSHPSPSRAPQEVPYPTNQHVAPPVADVPSTIIVPQPTGTHSMQTRSKAHIHKPRQFTDGIVPYPPKALLTEMDTPDDEPTSFTAANKLPEWRTAMTIEINALLQNGTWTLVPRQPHMNLVGCKWIYKIKRKFDGSIERYKARLVAKGFHQQPGIDYGDTFSPVVKPTTIRTVLSIAVSAKWSIKQLDVTNAFLHGFLQEFVYVVQPPGFIHPSFPDHVYHLRKSLYGLKQAPKAWFSRLSNRLIELGFHGSKADTSLFIHGHSASTIFILIYVDDILVTSPSTTLIDGFISKLQCDFPIKDLGSINYFLGVEVLPDPHGLFLSQRKYILDLLKKSNMLSAKPVTSPMSSSKTLSRFDGEAFHDPSLYCSIVGSFQYLSLTRPDVSFAVNKVCQFLQRPTIPHWTAVKRILRYLKQTLFYGLLLRRNSSAHLHAYFDTDWAGCPDDRRSIGGYCIFLGSNLISWSSRKQATVSRSSTEAEYRSLANTTAELQWLQSLLRELGVFLPKPPTLWCDNLGATYLTPNPMFHARTKHIEIDFHFVRDKVASKALEVRFISTKDQKADIFTKPLISTRFTSLRDNLNIIELPLQLRRPIKTVTNIQHQNISIPDSQHNTSAQYNPPTHAINLTRQVISNKCMHSLESCTEGNGQSCQALTSTFFSTRNQTRPHKAYQ
jgi:hypothetical protein